MKRGFLMLAGLTVLSIVATLLFVPSNNGTSDVAGNTPLVAGLSARINAVDKVEIIAAGNTPVATLLRNADTWQVQQMHGYQANWSRLQSLLSGLAQAQVVEVKTDKPEYYSRLGVEDIATETASNILVKLSDGTNSTAVLIGKRAANRKGQFVRLQGAAASALINQNLDVPAEQLEWLNKRIIDINSSEVAEVEIVHPKEGRVLITRISADQTDFDLVDLPLGRELKSSWAVNSLGSVLSLLDLESVQKSDDIDFSEAVRMRVLLFSGVELLADVLQRGDEKLFVLSASHPAAALAVTTLNDEISKRAAADVAKMVEQINARVGGWAYTIGAGKYQVMVKKPEDLLKPVEDS